MTQAILTAHTYSIKAFEIITDFLKDLETARLQRKEIRKTEKALSALSDSDLRDIGLHRGEIYDIARAERDVNGYVVNHHLKGWV